MNDQLILNGRRIIGLKDMRKNFYPLELLRQREAFITFARIHCIWINTQYNELDSFFWLCVVLEGGREGISDEVKCKLTEGAFCEYIKGLLMRFSPYKDDIEKEIKDAKIEQKTQFIKKKLDKIEAELERSNIKEKSEFIKEKLEDGDNKGLFCSNEEKNAAVITILAFAELCGIDLIVNPDLWLEPNENTNQEFAEPVLLDSGRDIITVFLGRTYSYFYHDEDELAEPQSIRTVKLTVGAEGDDSGTEVRIQLYSKTEKCCVDEIVMHKNENRYCNVASDGRVIRFLPLIVLNDKFCLIKTDRLYLYNEGSEPVAVNYVSNDPFSFDLTDEGGIFYASFDDSGADGSAKVNYMTSPGINACLNVDVAEIEVIGNECHFLRRDGTEYLLFDEYGAEGGTKKVSLYENGRKRKRLICEGYRDVCLSESKHSAAMLPDDRTKPPLVLFNGGFEYEKKEGRLVLNSNKESEGN